MKYELNTTTIPGQRKSGVFATLSSLWPLLVTEKKRLTLALLAIIANSILTLIAPIMIGHIIDTYIVSKQFHGVLVFSGILLLIYIGGLVTSYLQTTLMGTVGQRSLYNVRNALFTKIQSLPIAFFNQNKAGDLISRINNDTDKLNQFLSQSLVNFVGSVVVMIGAGIFLVALHPTLGFVALAPALFILIFTRVLSPWVRSVNLRSLKSTGALSAEIQESLENFKVIVAFNRRDYFRTRFDSANSATYDASVKAGVANNVFAPVYGLASNIAQLAVLAFGVYLISTGSLTLGLLVSFLSYATNFYTPLRQLAAVWANFQVAMAGWDRINAILELETDLVHIEGASHVNVKTDAVLSFEDVDFVYPNGTAVLRDISFALQRGKIYALVGPTGGGKTTTASLMARLYDPTQGTVLLHGKDIRTYSPEERTKKIGFILQEPFLFDGTLKDNIFYGSEGAATISPEKARDLLKDAGLEELLSRFEQGLDTSVSTNGESISLGQRQLVAFIRAVLRKPDILILDEATANVDTVTEEMLQRVLDALPKETTLVVIAHRLHTIAKADEIFFVNAGEIVNAGSMEHAVDMLMHGKRNS